MVTEKKNITYDDILSLEPKSMCKWIQKEFVITIPSVITSGEELQQAGGILTKLSSYYAYIMSLLSYTQITVREKKRLGNKTEYEDMVDRRNVIENTAHILNQQYAAVSRAVTIYLKHMEELRMTSCY